MSQKVLKSIRNIVVEEVTKYLDSMITESLMEAEKEPETKEISSAQRKTKERIDKANKRDGSKVGATTAQDVRNFLNDPTVNVSDVMVQATGLSPTSASSLGSKIANGTRPVKAKLAQTVHRIQNKLG